MVDGVLIAIAAGAASGLASVPHCAGMCSPLAALVCARSGAPTAPLRYALGRIVGYTVVGAVAGRFGLALISGLPVGAATLLLPAMTLFACVGLAWQLWGSTGASSPQLVAVGRSPSGRRKSGPLFWTRLLRVLPQDPLYVGMGSALLPCGALAAAALLAAGTGDGWLGGGLMAAFAGTSAVGTSLAGWVQPWLTRLGPAALRRGLAVAVLGYALVPGVALWQGFVAPSTNNHCHAKVVEAAP